MREMLEPVFGESGALVTQFIITLLVILILIALAYLLVGHFAGSRFRTGNRGRPPRLAVLDVASIDRRRKLVLVRRDNLEHLLLVGGSSDLVVETSIARRPPPPRPRPGQGPSTQPADASSEPVQPEPSPVIPRRPAAPGPVPEPARPDDRAPAPPRPVQVASSAEPKAPNPPRRRPPPAQQTPGEDPTPATNPPRGVSAHFEEPTRPSRIESIVSLGSTLEDIAGGPEVTGDAEEFVGPKAHQAPAAETPTPARRPEPPREELTARLRVDKPADAPQPAAPEAAAPAEEGTETEGATTSRVSDLEQEMARLLGEITSRRDTPA